MNGWTTANNNLRQNIIKVLNKDIVCIAESHLAKTKTISVEHYEWFSFNRDLKHVKSPVTHGGVGILVKNTILSLYSVSIIDKQVDGILAAEFKSKFSECNFIIFCCYLPPINSPWAEPTKFFGHLLSQLYLHDKGDLILMCGDFNARIGKETDLANFDHIPNRVALDTCKNGYCDIFLDFLKDSKCCVLNGRFAKDNFTSTHRGNAVVDYILTPHDCFKNCLNFDVLLMNDLLSEYDLFSQISAQSKPPDHSVLCVDIVFDKSTATKTQENMVNCKNKKWNTKKYDFENIPNAFMQSQNWMNQINGLLEMLQKTENQQCQLDLVYSEFCQCILAEMDKYINYKS